ncbi:MAG TPA: metallophosphoesterase, partial [Candidatus Deferrimicrobium sp.]|nr:metallophosphoesterase [Candidatus Deferrimicrobium sp.]
GTTWSFTHRDAHFAIVDNSKGTFPDDTLAWLDRDLAAHPKGRGGITTLIVAMHVPPASDGDRPHGTRFDYVERSEKLLAILKRHGVDAVLSGHEHIQHVEDWEGVLLLVSGGAGAPMVPFQSYGFYRIDVGNGRVRETFKPIRPKGKTP